MKCTVTGAVYQPLALGWLVAAGLIVGAVLSTLTVYEALPWLPGRSLQVAFSGSVPSPLEVLLVG